MKKIVRAVCAALAGVLILCALCLAVVYDVAYRPSFWENMADETYVADTVALIQDTVAADALYYGIDERYLRDGVDAKEVETACTAYCKRLGQLLCGEPADPVVAISPDGFLKQLDAFGDTLELRDELFHEEAAKEIATACAEQATACVNAINDNYVTTVSSVLHRPVLQFAVTNYWLFLAAGLLLAVVVLVLPGAPWLDRASLSTATVLTPSLLAFVFFVLIRGFDFSAKLAVAGPLKRIIDSVIARVEWFAPLITGIVALVSGLALLVLMVLRIRKTIRTKTTEE